MISQALKTAEKNAKDNPQSAAAWAALLQAQYTAAGEGSNYNSTTNTYSASGKKLLQSVADSWVGYTALTSTPNANIAIYAARAYAQLANYAGEANAWEMYTLTQPTVAKGFECLAASAYAAKQTRKGELAAAKAVALSSKLQQLTVKEDPHGGEDLAAGRAGVLSAAACAVPG